MYQRERSTSSLKLVSYSDFESYDIFVSLSRLRGFLLHYIMASQDCGFDLFFSRCKCLVQLPYRFVVRLLRALVCSVQPSSRLVV